MGTHSAQSSGGGEIHLPDVVPFELSHLTRMSWELGSRVVDDEESILHSGWEHASTAWTLAIYHVTSNTVLLCLRTPVARERFYGATQAEVESAISRLESASSWHRTD